MWPWPSPQHAQNGSLRRSQWRSDAWSTARSPSSSSWRKGLRRARARAKSRRGWNGSSAAASCGERVVRLLLEAGADKDAENPAGNTALILAAIFGEDDCVETLIEWGAAPDKTTNDGNTALHWAAGKGQVECVRLLMAAGADPTKPNAHGDSALDSARLGKTQGKAEVVAEVVALLEQGGALARDRGVEAVDTGPQRTRLTTSLPRRPRLSAVSASSSESDKAGGKNLIDSVDTGDVPGVRGALKRGANPNAKDEHGNNPVLVTAAQRGDHEVLGMLLMAGANPEATDKKGLTALMTAASSGKAECVGKLLDAGAQVDAVNKRGNTALHFAAAYGQLECARLLVRARADRAKENGSGKTALDLAQEKDHAEFTELLGPRRRTTSRPRRQRLSAVATSSSVSDKAGVEPEWHQKIREAHNSWICPLSLSLMKDPVTDAEGHTYERKQIEQWFDAGHTTSPKTGAELENTKLTPNFALRNTIDEHLIDHSLKGKAEDMWREEEELRRRAAQRRRGPRCRPPAAALDVAPSQHDARAAGGAQWPAVWRDLVAVHVPRARVPLRCVAGERAAQRRDGARHPRRQPRGRRRLPLLVAPCAARRPPKGSRK